MEIIKIRIDDIVPYENNAKEHPREQIEQIKESIKEFGNNDPIAVDEDNVIIEGHGRLVALKELGYKEAECIRLEGLTDDQKNAYRLIHNKLTMNSGFDMEALEKELKKITDVDMEGFGFSDEDLKDLEEAVDGVDGDKYTMKDDAPVYNITGDNPDLSELVDESKCDELIDEIEASDVPEDIKGFLKKAAYRHLQFDYKAIAEYYAHAPKEVQELMEKSALVIIDFDSAIKNGFVKLSKRIEEMRKNEGKQA